ncbi:MAG TPA: D-alanyl-D-alanine carboxypeptidase [Ferruginibacter sp.]|nr:D-alanyl-D-alanine carboxypeptidase [Ferruginibacter sp.]
MKNIFRLSYSLFIISYFLFALSSCSVNKQITKQANKILLQDSAIRQGQIGISIYEPATGKYWYNHDADKYFIPASNTKLFSLYAGMKYLGDSLVGLRYYKDKDTTYIRPAGDPTFLLKEFPVQPVFEFLKNQNNIVISIPKDVAPYGNGWAWNDYMYEYMAPRSVFPIYGNLVSVRWISGNNIKISPSWFENKIMSNQKFEKGFEVNKSFDDNNFQFVDGKEKSQSIPFYPDLLTISKLLDDTLKLKENLRITTSDNGIIPIFSQPSDSLFKPMMHRSDNFFAEQTLLMASNEHLGYMSDKDIIDTILKSDLKDIPQKPKWVDGSGLSRYNLFTPQSFVHLLNKLKNEFGWERIKNILPTGGEGTLGSYYKTDAGFIFAKTGTLSNNCALSGYLITHKGKFLIFSILANNYITGATPVRKAVERFLKQIRDID